MRYFLFVLLFIFSTQGFSESIKTWRFITIVVGMNSHLPFPYPPLVIIGNQYASKEECLEALLEVATSPNQRYTNFKKTSELLYLYDEDGTSFKYCDFVWDSGLKINKN